MRKSVISVLLLVSLSTVISEVYAEKSDNPYGIWEHGPSSDPGYFPIAVWLQSPLNAQKYKAAGINLFVGLWQGPTEEQLEDLREAGMQVVCYQNETGLKYIDDPVIVGWMHGDEPDNAQSDGSGGYDPPILPEVIIDDYDAIKTADPSRPVFLNLGQGVAWDDYIGRGVRRNHPDDYTEYVKGGDVVSFDIYPVNSTYPEIEGNLWYVPRGVDRLHEWSDNGKIIWNCIECTRIRTGNKPTPDDVRSEVWMSLIHGSRGLIYFCHEFSPFNEDGLLDDPEMLEAVTAFNNHIHELAPVLNSPTLAGYVETVSSEEDIPVDTLAKLFDGELYLFSVCMRNGQTQVSFTLNGTLHNATVEVIGEDRYIDLVDGTFGDTFEPYEVHLYRIADYTTSVDTISEPASVKLHTNYPNPFNPLTGIGFYMPRNGFAELVINTVTGQQIAVLYSSYTVAGNHSFVWNASDKPSGIYFYTLKTANFLQTKKMLLLK